MILTENEIKEIAKKTFDKQMEQVKVSVGKDELTLTEFLEDVQDGTFMIYKTDDFIEKLEELKKKSLEASANHYVRDGIDLVIDMILTGRGRQERKAHANY